MINRQNNITIIAVSDIKIKETLNSLIISSNHLNPAKTIFFTSKSFYIDKKESKIVDKVKIRPIKSIKNYSDFIIYSLYKYINTSHILIVQWDGYILNQKKWNEKFLKYDYVGAPFIPRDDDDNYSRDKSGRFYSIGNGGFSLRSKRLLEAPSKYNLFDDKFFTSNHEDGFFSILHRDFLESKGFKWAPFIVANQFSIESPLSLKDLKELPFGFHGRKLYYFLKIKNFIEKLLLKTLKN